MKTLKLEIPIEMLYTSESLILIAPTYSEEKGWGYVMSPITRELFESECKSILNIIDEAIRFYSVDNCLRVSCDSCVDPHCMHECHIKGMTSE